MTDVPPQDRVPFKLLDPARPDPAQAKALEPPQPDLAKAKLLARRRIPVTLGSHIAAAKHFQASDELVTAVNVALAVGAPLLLTGEPGTGKTQVAFYVSWYFGLEASTFPLYVRSTTTWTDLLYQFDTVAYFHAAHDPQRSGGRIDKSAFVKKGPLWQAYESAVPTIVLIDEIDKAPRDFPNDLLNVLERHGFTVAELEDLPVKRREDAAPPLVIITSNSERRLPEPFLRRCIFHHIEFSDDLMRKAVRARARDFPELDEETRNAAIERVIELRKKNLRKKPSTAELLVWLTVLSAHGNVTAQTLRSTPLARLPALGALVKDREDLAELG